MLARVQKWGNSLAVRIPKPFAEEIGIRQDSEVEVELSGGNLLVRPKRRKKQTLDSLLARVKKSQLHGEQSFGPPRGREAL